MSWNPTQYLKYTAARLRPAVDLLNGTVASCNDVKNVKKILDLGCGPGNITQLLCETFPNAEVIGLDSSKEMITRAWEVNSNKEYSNRIKFELDTIESALESNLWNDKYDIVYSNASLHWVTNHHIVLPKIMSKWVTPANGVFACQMPDTRNQQSHVLMETAALRTGLLDLLEDIRIPRVEKEPRYYYHLLFPTCKDVDMWTTEYLKELPTIKSIHDDRGQTRHPVLEYTRSTGLLPIIQALGGESTDLCQKYLNEYERLLEEEYPATNLKNRYYSNGKLVTIMPFKRFFFVCKM